MVQSVPNWEGSSWLLKAAATAPWRVCSNSKVDETKDFIQLVNWELLQCLCLSRGTEKTGQSFQHAQSPLENFLHLSGY